MYSAFWGAMFPNSKILLFFFIPMPVWAFIGGVFAVSPIGLNELTR